MLQTSSNESTHRGLEAESGVLVTELTKKCKQKPPTNMLANIFPWDDVEFCENDVTAEA